ncbi:MAG: VOC family protein [Ilumatobacteraceae bacterium]
METSEPTFQIVVGAHDPHLLNRFWSAAVGYEAEDHHDQVEQLTEAGFIGPDDVVEIDGRKAFMNAAACRDPQGVRPRLLFQVVDEPKTAKNRVHLDLQRGLDDTARAAEVSRLEKLGATTLWEGEQGPHRWTAMADPEGNEFCVS